LGVCLLVLLLLLPPLEAAVVQAHPEGLLVAVGLVPALCWLVLWVPLWALELYLLHHSQSDHHQCRLGLPFSCFRFTMFSPSDSDGSIELSDSELQEFFPLLSPVRDCVIGSAVTVEPLALANPVQSVPKSTSVSGHLQARPDNPLVSLAAAGQLLLEVCILFPLIPLIFFSCFPGV
jgi:hypothetical protein